MSVVDENLIEVDDDWDADRCESCRRGQALSSGVYTGLCHDCAADSWSFYDRGDEEYARWKERG